MKHLPKIFIGMLATGVIGGIVYFGADTDDTSLANLQKKYNISEIKADYVLEGATLKTTPKDDPKDRIEVWIGEKTDPALFGAITNFEPKLTIARWDSEVEFSIKPIAFDSVALKDRTLKFDKEKTIFETPKIDYSLYEMPISEANPEGAFEYEIILKSKPATNKIEFTLQDTDVDYFLQPPLTQQEIDEGAVRPENVVGSYAVYAKTPKTNWTGGKEYKVGKIGHIFRPHIIDSAGTEVWGDLHIENGILSVTIPQDFLDKAVYPVIVDPTFGYTTIGALEDNSEFAQNSYARATSNPTSDGTVTKVTIYGRNGGSGRIDCAVYSSDAGDAGPNSRLGFNDLGPTIDNTSGWDDCTVSASVTSGVQYWLAFQEEFVNYDSGGTNRYKTSGAANWPATADDDTSWTATYSIYATYTAAEGAAPSQASDLIIFE